MLRLPCCAQPSAPRRCARRLEMKRARCWCLGLLILFAAGVGCAKDLVIHAGTLLDGIVDLPRHQVSIVVRDDKVLAIEAGFVSPAGVEVIDLSNAVVMPGFIDC